MSDLKICRICLRTETKMYKFDQYQLLYYYEEVMALKVNPNDEIPHYFCYECAFLLQKFYKFKEKCFRGYKMLMERLNSGPITYECIDEINRPLFRLTSTIGILKVSKKVKTYTVSNSFTDSDDETIKQEDDHNEIKNKGFHQEFVNAFSDCYEPEIFVHTGKPDDNKPLPFDFTIVKEDEFSDYEEHIGTNINQEIDWPSSPLPLVENNENVKELKIEPVKRRKKKTVAIIEPRKRYKFNKKSHTALDPMHWKKMTLTEEEAVKQFRDRAEDPKYLSRPFKCVDCFKGFMKEDIMKRHRLLKHDESLKHECRFCRTRYKWNAYLHKHMREHFNKYECLRCHRVCPLEGTAKLHNDYHSGGVKKCKHCSEEFTHMSTYYTHLRTHRSEFLCPLCGASFVSPAGLHMHKRKKHIDQQNESSEKVEKEADASSTYCEKCDVRFETRRAYDEHLFHSAKHIDGVEHEFENDLSIPKKILGKIEKAMITKDLKRDRNQTVGSTEAPFKYTRIIRKKRKNACKPTDYNQKGTEDCINKDMISVKDEDTPLLQMAREAERSKSDASLNYSRKRAKGGNLCTTRKPMNCYQCGKHFESQSACMRHHLAEHPRTSSHLSLKKTMCEICGVLLAPTSLPQHMNMHTRKKMHSCETCGRSFYASISLKRHLLTHTGEKPHGCTLCDKRFTQKNSMQLHYRTFHLKEPYPKRNRRKKEKIEESDEG